jgi:hypothetical protein
MFEALPAGEILHLRRRQRIPQKQMIYTHLHPRLKHHLLQPFYSHRHRRQQPQGTLRFYCLE